MSNAQTQEGRQEPRRDAQSIAPVSKDVAPVLESHNAPACAADGCCRRCEWRIAAVDHDGATIRAWLACREHRGQTTTTEWRVEPAIVEIRQYEADR
jgi:hypothetical protein